MLLTGCTDEVEADLEAEPGREQALDEGKADSPSANAIAACIAPFGPIDGQISMVYPVVGSAVMGGVAKSYSLESGFVVTCIWQPGAAEAFALVDRERGGGRRSIRDAFFDSFDRTVSWKLGFPIANEVETEDGLVQEFEHGRVWVDATGNAQIETDRDPFDPADCAGLPMSFSGGTSFVQPAQTRVLAETKLVKQARTCTAAGCSAWSEVPSDHTAKLQLRRSPRVSMYDPTTTIAVQHIGKTGICPAQPMHCGGLTKNPGPAQMLGCSEYIANNPASCAGTFVTLAGQRFALRGNLTNHCVRMDAMRRGPVTSSGAYVEERAAVLSYF